MDTTPYQPNLMTQENEYKEEILVMNVDDLPENSLLCSKPPARDLISDMRLRGQVVPIKIAKIGENKVFVVSGSKRIMAARIIGMKTLRVVMSEMTLADAMTARSAENAVRTDNDLADIEAIKYCQDYLHTPTAKGISVVTGINIGRVKSLLRMMNMPVEISSGVQAGHISASTAKKYSKLSPSIQKMALEKLRNNKAIWENRPPEKRPTIPVLLSGDDINSLQKDGVQIHARSIPMPDINVSMQKVFMGVMNKEKGTVKICK